MKYSELDISKLTLDEKYELIMHGITNLSNKEARDDEKVDFLIVLGGRPATLKARIIKTIELYKRGYGKYILFSGGHGWNKGVEENSEKDIEMIDFIKTNISPRLNGIERTSKEKEVLARYETYIGKNKEDEEIDLNKRIRDLSETQIMARMLQTLSDIPESCIYHEPFSTNTKENMEYTSALLKSLQKRGEVSEIKSIMLVTSSFHCRRSMLTFKKYLGDLKITSCPTTLDMKERGVTFEKSSILNNNYYRKQIEDEVQRIFDYIKNGSFEDADIDELVGEEYANKIRINQRNKNVNIVDFD